MKEIRGNLFDPTTYSPAPSESPDAICLTTNGFVKSNGEAVMGRGCAKQAAEMRPGLSKIVGKCITELGNKTQIVAGDLSTPWKRMVIFPVKPTHVTVDRYKRNIVSHMQNQFQPGAKAPGWAAKASVHLIQASALQLRDLADAHGWRCVILPRPGCGAGELSWDEVKPLLEEILDDRFYCITY